MRGRGDGYVHVLAAAVSQHAACVDVHVVPWIVSHLCRQSVISGYKRQCAEHATPTGCGVVHGGGRDVAACNS